MVDSVATQATPDLTNPFSSGSVAVINTDPRKTLGQNQETYFRLKASLGLNLRRQIFVAVCDNLILRDRLVRQLQLDLSEASRSSHPSSETRQSVRYPRLVSLNLDIHNPNPIIQISQWLAKYPPPQRGNLRLPMPAFQILGIEQLSRQPASTQWLFLTYLQSIERSLPALESSILFWLPRPWVRIIPQSAPEFWHCRTAIFDFLGEPTPLISREKRSLAASSAPPATVYTSQPFSRHREHHRQDAPLPSHPPLESRLESPSSQASPNPPSPRAENASFRRSLQHDDASLDESRQFELDHAHPLPDVPSQPQEQPLDEALESYDRDIIPDVSEETAPPDATDILNQDLIPQDEPDGGDTVSPHTDETASDALFEELLLQVDQTLAERLPLPNSLPLDTPDLPSTEPEADADAPMMPVESQRPDDQPSVSSELTEPRDDYSDESALEPEYLQPEDELPPHGSLLSADDIEADLTALAEADSADVTDTPNEHLSEAEFNPTELDLTEFDQALTDSNSRLDDVFEDAESANADASQAKETGDDTEIDIVNMKSPDIPGIRHSDARVNDTHGDAVENEAFNREDVRDLAGELDVELDALTVEHLKLDSLAGARDEVQPFSPDDTDVTHALGDRASVHPSTSDRAADTPDADAQQSLQEQPQELDIVDADPNFLDFTLTGSADKTAQQTHTVSQAIDAEIAEKLRQDAPSDPQTQSFLNQIENLHRQQAPAMVLAHAYRSLGNLYRDRIEQGDASNQTLMGAMNAYEQVLRWLDEGSPMWAEVLNDMGNLCWLLSRSALSPEQGLPYLQQGIQFYQVALTKISPQTHPQTYPMIQNNVGAAYGDLARYQEPAENLQRSIQAYQEALRYRKAEDDPMRYASTQNNLGTTYWNLAQHNHPKEHLKQAITAYAEALRYYRPEQEPLNYAMIQNNLGTAYWNLAQFEQPQDWLALALGAYRMALKYRTLDTVPSAFAATQNNLGTAYWHLASHTDDNPTTKRDYLERAIAAYDQALFAVNKIIESSVPTPLNFDVLATYNNLGLVHYELATDAQITLSKEGWSDHLQAALASHVAALQGWQQKPELRQTAIQCIVQAVRAFFTKGGVTGQNLALSKLPGSLLPEILPKL
ncbi:MAG: hypothetical protein ACFE0J_24995 [Elainellaceae cyanobacterium]